MKLGVREERRDEEGNPNSAPFERGFSELRVWGKSLWILIRIYIPRVWGSDIYIYLSLYIYLYIEREKVFNVGKMEMEKPSDAVLKLEATAKLFQGSALSALLSGLQAF